MGMRQQSGAVSYGTVMSPIGNSEKLVRDEACDSTANSSSIIERRRGGHIKDMIQALCKILGCFQQIIRCDNQFRPGVVELRNEAGMPRHGKQHNAMREMKPLCFFPPLHGDAHEIESCPWKL